MNSRKQKRIWTYQPYEAIWNQLRLFTSQANVRKLLSGEMDSGRSYFLASGSLLEKKSSQVASAISQAYEYYKAADSVTVVTSPLLYFYGMLSLAKALIVANQKDILLQDTKYHGLSSRPDTSELSSYVNDESEWSIEREFAVIKPGVFQWLTLTTQNFEYPESAIIFIKELLRVDPELSDAYSSLYKETPCVQYLYDIRQSDDPFSLELYPNTTDKESFEKGFPEITTDFNYVPGLKHNQALVYVSKQNVKAFPEYLGVYYPVPGGRFLVRGLRYRKNNKDFLRFQYPEISDYVLMFILSNCVRYKQEFWNKLILGEKTGSIGIINLALSNARLRYPNFILNELFIEKFEFAVKTSLM